MNDELTGMIERASAPRLARLGGTESDVKPAPVDARRGRVAAVALVTGGAIPVEYEPVEPGARQLSLTRTGRCA